MRLGPGVRLCPGARLADAGIAVIWSEFTSGPPLPETLGAGALDFGPTAEAPPPFAQAARGKSTLPHLLAGLDQPTEGVIERTGASGPSDIRIMFQEPRLPP